MNKKVKTVLLIFFILLILLTISVCLAINSNEMNLKGSHIDSIAEQSDRYIRQPGEEGPEGVPASVAIPANGVIPEIQEEVEKYKQEDLEKLKEEMEQNQSVQTASVENTSSGIDSLVEEYEKVKKQNEENSKKLYEILYKYNEKEKVDNIHKEDLEASGGILQPGQMNDKTAAWYELLADTILNNELSEDENEFIKTYIDTELNKTTNSKYDTLKAKLVEAVNK